MQRTATVNVYDALDQVVVTVVVRQWTPWQTAPIPEPLVASVQVRSVGCDDDREWLKRALGELLQDL